MREFTIAYEIVSSMTQEEAQERLSLLKRYFLPFEKEISPKLFTEIMSQGKDLELVKDKGIFFIHLYNLILRKAKGEELIKEEEKEYALYQEYKDLLNRFPDVEIERYSEEAVRFFSVRHKKLIEKIAKRRGVKTERFSKCTAPPRIVKDKKKEGYLYLACYGKGKDRVIAHGKEEYVRLLHTIGTCLIYGREGDD